MSSTVRGNGQAHGVSGGEGGPETARSAERPLLMAGTTLAPCIGCTLECFPRSCELLTGWIGLLEPSPRGPGDPP